MSAKIDVLSFNPGEVATKLIYKDKSQAGGSIIPVEKAVDCCFRDVGLTDVTYGAFVHEMGGWNFGNMPQWLLASVAAGTTKENIDEHVKKETDAFEKAKVARADQEGTTTQA